MPLAWFFGIWVNVPVRKHSI